MRLLISKHIDWEKIGQYSDFAELLDKETIALCNIQLNYAEIKEKFIATFNLLFGVLGEDSFKKYNGAKHAGPVMASVFQTIAIGIYENIDKILAIENTNEWLTNKVHSLYSEKVFQRNTTPGVRSIPRFKELSQFGIQFFKP